MITGNLVEPECQYLIFPKSFHLWYKARGARRKSAWWVQNNFNINSGGVHG